MRGKYDWASDIDTHKASSGAPSAGRQCSENLQLRIHLCAENPAPYIQSWLHASTCFGIMRLDDERGGTCCDSNHIHFCWNSRLRGMIRVSSTLSPNRCKDEIQFVHTDLTRRISPVWPKPWRARIRRRFTARVDVEADICQSDIMKTPAAIISMIWKYWPGLDMCHCPGRRVILKPKKTEIAITSLMFDLVILS